MGISPSREELAALAAVLAVVAPAGENPAGEGFVAGGPSPSPRPGFSPWAYYGRIRLMEGRRPGGRRGGSRPGG